MEEGKEGETLWALLSNHNSIVGRFPLLAWTF